jgi:hypothetical protein
MSGKYQPDFKLGWESDEAESSEYVEGSSVPNEQGLMIGLQFREVATLAR